MDVSTIEISPDEARARLREYRSRKHRDAEAEYEAAKRLLEAAADGFPILNVGDAIALAPHDQHGRPLLAIARADRRQVELNWKSKYSHRIVFDASVHRQTDGLTLRFNKPELHGREIRRGFATVPMVPPSVRPETGQLRDWFILFEVDRWLDRPLIDPPVDPLLLERIDGEYFKVLAEWDLTEIERAAMRIALG